MISNPLVSVIVLSYNNKAFLEECIQSILSQDYSNMEIIVADDFSTDGSIELLHELQQKNPDKIKLLLATKNNGITINSNHAVQACTGKYVAWMGSDDVMLPEKLSRQVAHMEANPNCTIVYHNLEVFDSETNKVLGLFNTKQNAHVGKIATMIKYGTFNGACATMTRRSEAPAGGLYLSIPVASDWLYWVDHLSTGGEIQYIDKILGRYRRHGANVTSYEGSFGLQGYKDLLETIRIIREKYPQYKEETEYRLSVIYRSGRRLEYLPNILKSLKHNYFNFYSWIFLGVYCITFTKIKL